MATGPANDPDVVDGNPLPWEDESFFARDIDGQLVRYEGPRIEDFGVFVQVLVDDEPVTVRKAKPATDAQGNIIRDERGRLIPRDTTVYDAVHARYVKNTGDVHPIPVLCHQEYMRPAGVCRLCSVLVGRIDRKTGETRLGRKPVPACWHPVSNEMTVYTTEGGTKGAKELRQTVGTLLSLLVQNHPQNVSANGVDDTTNNELLTLARRFKDDMPDLGHVVPSQRKQALDDSSPLMLVNHDACILCNRCVRACDEIKFNNVIGKHGKGFRSQIAFDLNDAMGESSCVACGECMISCPTDALTLKSTAEFRSDWAKSCEQLGAEPLSGRELQQRHSFFREISLKFLEWNASAAVLWSLADTSEGKKAPAKNKPLCKEGDYGSTAYILLKGRYAIFAGAHKADDTGASEGGFSGVLGKLFGDRFGRADKVAAPRNPPPSTTSLPIVQPPRDLDGVIRELEREYGQFVGIRTPDEEHMCPDDPLSKAEILGEMSCMNYRPRTATVVPLDADCEFIEIRRNILYMLLRDPKARENLRQIYEQRAKATELRKLSFLDGLDEQKRDQCIDFLRSNIKLLFVAPGDPIFRKDLKSKYLYVVRSGYVRFWQADHGKTRVLNYFGPGKYFGEGSLLEGMRDSLREPLSKSPNDQSGRRGSNCSALDHVELLSLNQDAFREMLLLFPELQDEFISRYRYYRESDAKVPETDSLRRESFLEQGVFNAQKMLVLDLERCTRCDECTKACADTHNGTTRLIRDGRRIDNFLVASACRSCEDPYCLVGCPVDAIHRGKALEITIESHCIGCGLCANNCPYGNINMIENSGRPIATTCDLCESVGAAGISGEVSCVTACPHEAAFRVSSSELWSRLSTKTMH